HDVMCVKVSERGDVPLLTLLVPARCVPQLLGLQGDFVESSSQHAEEHSVAGRLELEAVRRLAAELSGRAPDAIELQRCVSPMAAVLRESAAARWAVALIALGEAKS